MLIEPGSPVLDELEGDDVTLRLRLRELLDPPITDWPGQSHVEAARQLRGFVGALLCVVDVLEDTAEAMSEFPADDNGDDPERWAETVAAFDRMAAEREGALRDALRSFDHAMADGFEP